MGSLPNQNAKTGKNAKGRNRRGVRRQAEPLRKRLTRMLDHPSAVWNMITLLVFTGVIGVFVSWAMEQPQLVYSRTARDTRTSRVEFDAYNAQQTLLDKDSARQKTPRVYKAIESAIDTIIGDVARLPTAAALADPDAPTAGGSAAELLRSLALSAEQITALREIARDPAESAAWLVKTKQLKDVLLRNPLLPRAEWGRARTEGRSRQLELITTTGSEQVPREQAISIGDETMFTGQVALLIDRAGFEPPLADAVLAVLRANREATFVYDDEETTARQDQEAEKILAVIDKRSVGQKIFERGDVITPSQLLMYEQELSQYLDHAPPAQIWANRAGTVGMVAFATLAFSIALGTLCPGVAVSPLRVVWVACLTGSTVILAGVSTIVDPTFIALTSTAPVALATVLALTVFNRLAAVLIGALTSVLVSVVLTPSHGYVIINLIGVATVLFTLPVIRDRGSIVTMSLWLAACLGLATVIDRLAGLPLDQTRLVEIASDAAGAGFGGLLVGGITLFILPWVERVFNVTTGMTLVELRDPKQQLLRELQQKAPGTYNHSLNVATIAESAAAAIDADTLLTYAGALYHDIGKMTKPEYFVENQSGGPNRHDRLSPAMSVLVIIGHVKDGLELAREYGLPKPLHHFIEAHHGTTLVEYFFHRAKKNAEGDEVEQTPEEFDYRYPGPKPRTKEAAILMLADSIESATRTLREPTPSRIESLVDELANKRLMDGQFDECDLTLRELHRVCDSISKTVSSIYHGRVQYPGDKKDEKKPGAPEKSGDPPETRDKSA